MFDVGPFQQASISPNGRKVAWDIGTYALRTLGVPTKLVIYPHEGHHFADPVHSRDPIERAVAWLNQYSQPH